MILPHLKWIRNFGDDFQKPEFLTSSPGSICMLKMILLLKFENWTSRKIFELCWELCLKWYQRRNEEYENRKLATSMISRELMEQANKQTEKRSTLLCLIPSRPRTSSMKESQSCLGKISQNFLPSGIKWWMTRKEKNGELRIETVSLTGSHTKILRVFGKINYNIVQNHI